MFEIGGVKRQWGCRRRQFSSFSLAICSETLDRISTIGLCIYMYMTMAVNNDDGSNWDFWEWSLRCSLLVCVTWAYAIGLVLSSTCHFLIDDSLQCADQQEIRAAAGLETARTMPLSKFDTYISIFTAASRGSFCDNRAFLLTTRLYETVKNSHFIKQHWKFRLANLFSPIYLSIYLSSDTTQIKPHSWVLSHIQLLRMSIGNNWINWILTDNKSRAIAGRTARCRCTFR